MLKKLIKVPARVVIDTGPLLLFLTGNYSPDSLPKMKRIRYDGGPCNKVHYDVLLQYLNHAKEILITPGVLSETWNLIDNDISDKKCKKNLFVKNISYFKIINEIYVSKDEILADNYLSLNAHKYGFTDASIILCAKNNHACVLTHDFPLFNICKTLKIDSNYLDSILSLADA